MKYQAINETEIADFRKGCKNCGFNPDDFKLKEHDVQQIPQGNGLQATTGKVTIARNGFSKIYLTGHGSSWAASAISDITSGNFGKKSNN